jgi:hypothetical protein
MTLVANVAIAWAIFNGAIGIFAALRLHKAERENRRLRAWGRYWKSNALTAVDALGIARADVAKWSTRWGRTMSLLGIAEKANGVLMARVLRYEQETVE